MKVHELMTRTPLSVDARATIAQAWEAIQSLDVRHLPVLNEDRELVGIVSDRDFGRPSRARRRPEECNLRRARFARPGGFGAREREAQMATLFLCGDLMTGRGVDQILPHPSDRRIHEDFIADAGDYVALAEDVSGPIPSPVPFSYIWGEALGELARVDPEVRIVNLETSVTQSEDFWRGKGINYRMHPENVPCLTVAGIDVCVLANNHVLDYGYGGLIETLETLHTASLETAGAGRSLAEARRPALIDLGGGGRVLVFALATETSGVPPIWAATDDRPGVDFLPGLSEREATEIESRVREAQAPGDLVVASLHWGGNWGYAVPPEHVRLAHRLIDGGVDIVHGHSSHHARPIEVYRERLVLYGCGDFINDYEGIRGYEPFRGDLRLMYFVKTSPSGELASLRLVPMQSRALRLERASSEDAEWLGDMICRISAPFGVEVAPADRSLVLKR